MESAFGGELPVHQIRIEVRSSLQKRTACYSGDSRQQLLVGVKLGEFRLPTFPYQVIYHSPDG